MSIFNGAVEKSTNASSSGGIYKIKLYHIEYRDYSNQSLDVSISGFTDLDKMIFIYDEAYGCAGQEEYRFFISSKSKTSVTLKCSGNKSSGYYVSYGTLYVIQFK